MHANMKFYVVSMGGIFISLGIGMLVGFNLNYDQELSNQQTEIIKDLDSKFEVLKDTNNSLKEDLNKLNLNYGKAVDFISNNASKLTAGELESQKIGIITINSTNANYIQDAITNANGNVLFNINITSKALDSKILEELSSKLEVEVKTTEDFVSYLIEALNKEDFESKLKQLEELGLINLNILEDKIINSDSVVLMNNTTDEQIIENTRNIEKALVEKLKNENKYLIGVKTINSSYNMELYSENSVSTIDNIDEGTGQLALVSLLKDRNIVGNFGSSEGSDSLIPYK